jgi:hypothetical protein
MAKKRGFILYGSAARAAVPKPVGLTKARNKLCGCDCHNGKVNPHLGSKCLCKKRPEKVTP